jgi:hypothetical protein
MIVALLTDLSLGPQNQRADLLCGASEAQSPARANVPRVAPLLPNDVPVGDPLRIEQV